jgi:hypothetical protein
MATCLIYNGDNVKLSSHTIEQCPGYVVIEPQEYAEMQFLTQAFEVPEIAQLQELYVWAFGVVLIPYMAAWGYQTIISFFDDGNSFNNTHGS